MSLGPKHRSPHYANQELFLGGQRSPVSSLASAPLATSLREEPGPLSWGALASWGPLQEAHAPSGSNHLLRGGGGDPQQGKEVKFGERSLEPTRMGQFALKASWDLRDHRIKSFLPQT